MALLVFLPGELLRVGPNERLEQQFVMPSNCSNIYGIDMSNASAERTCCLGNAQCSEQNTQYAACTLYLFNSGICWGEYWSLWIYEYGSGAIYAYNGCMSSSAIALQFSDDGANSAYQAEQANCDNMNAAVVSSAVSGQTACLQGCSSQGQ